MAEHEDGKDTRHQPHINMFNHNRIGDVFIHLSPAINGWALFTILLVTLFIGVYWWTHPHDFIALVFNSVNTVAGFLNILMWLLIATIGGFILNKLFLPFLKGLIEIWRPAPAVHAVNEHFAVYSGQLQVHDHQEPVAKVKALPPADETEVPQLPPPTVPTGRQLLIKGVVEEALAEGYVILGMGDNGKLQRLMIKKLFSMLISGLPATGKTTTVFWIIGQLTLIGVKLWLVDPHMFFQDEDGNKSLAAELDALADAFVFPPCDDDPDEIVKRIQWMYNQLRIRQQPGYIVRAEDTVIGIMDEFNSVADSIDPKRIVVTHRDQPLNFAQTLALVEREGRKYGLHFMLIGHKWAKQDIGGDNAVRTNATTYLCHKLNDTRQADLLLGQGQGKKVLALATGTYWITGSAWNAEPTKIATPMISALDLPVLLQIKRRGGVQVINQSNVVDATPMTSAMASSGASMGRPFEESGRHSGRDTNQPGQPLDATTEELSLPPELRSKTQKVLDMDAQSANQNDIIREVWGIDPDSRAGRAAKEELKSIRAYMGYGNDASKVGPFDIT